MIDPEPSEVAKRRRLFVSTVLVALVFVAGGVWLTVTTAPESEVTVERVDFLLPSLDGEELGPQAYAGKVVVIDFWATWCAPCRVQADILEAIHRDTMGQDVEFLAVSVGEDEATVRSFVEDTPFPYPVLYDPEDRVSSQLGIYALPTVVILDRDGAIAYQHSGISSEATVRTVLSQAGLSQAGLSQAGLSQPGSIQPESSQSVSSQPGSIQPGSTQAGTS